MPSVISGDANVSATEFGFLDGVTSSLQSQIDSKLPLAGGKILQIVRSTNSTSRSTTSTSFVDVTGSSITITPTLATSAIIVFAYFYIETANNGQMEVQITDSSNNALSGAERSTYIASGSFLGSLGQSVGYSTPATTSATTYKLRFKTNSGTAHIYNSLNTGQMFAYEVSA